MFAAYDESRASRRGAGLKDTAEYVTDSFVQGVLNLPDLVVSGGDFLSNKIAGEDAKFETGKLYEPFTFAEEELEKNLQKTSMDERVNNVMLDIASGGGYKSPNLANPEYLKIFESLSKEDVKNQLLKEDEKYGIESMVEEEPEETPLQNQGIFSILAKPTYKGVL